MISTTRSPGSIWSRSSSKPSGRGRSSRRSARRASIVGTDRVVASAAGRRPGAAAAAALGASAAAARAAAAAPSTRPRSIGGATNLLAASGSSSVTGRNSVKVLPWPGVLSTRISPPSSRAISRLIDRPRPVPPYLRLVVPSACWNASKMSCCLSFAMPMPVSRTSKAITPPSTRSSVRLANRRSFSARRIVSVTPPRSGELERVRQQVLEDLLQPLRRRCRSATERPSRCRR